MPEVVFRVRWPDSSVQRCYSPSTVVEEHFTAGEAYPVAEFVERSRAALTLASERVLARFGFPCLRAAAQLADIERRAGAFRGREEQVVVEGFEQ
ncbi:MSMEG_0570 family nitrogen starvation response protein [Amycolatopsis carbonis]|uniref:MSMEG_0570 family nitrogen starvation response protein n=1 Tax=Amycolatopsis carbonis TaxID=715471 RepID=A0A9Y2IHV3_9PSEU|nr:MSMEG_0570 family nitrogen starvation response protein [Amycolatopsis sp. 2-15]WIX80057.1 MSMEG_0570 family nitrogen starvation response protein [Amycolatopsis sp. 2-15]